MTRQSPEVPATQPCQGATPRTNAHIQHQNDSIPRVTPEEALINWCTLARTLERELATLTTQAALARRLAEQIVTELLEDGDASNLNSEQQNYYDQKVTWVSDALQSFVTHRAHHPNLHEHQKNKE